MAEQRPAYDETERERIRRALTRYKEQHKVGVPTLQLRIAEAIGDRNPDRIPLKSLQRFLAASHRTDDALVHHCANFLSTVAPPPAEERTADTLTQFLMQEPDLDADCGEFAGTYHGRFRAGRPVSVNDRYEYAYSVLSLKSSGHPHFLIAEQLVFNWDRTRDENHTHSDIFRIAIEPLPLRYSGVFLPYTVGGGVGRNYLLLLRNYVHMQQYLLWKRGWEPPYGLTGNGIEPPLGAGISRTMPAWTPEIYIEFSPAPAEEPVVEDSGAIIDRSE